MIQIQLTSTIHRGLLAPAIQLLYLTPRMRLCIEHLSSPDSCFAEKPNQTTKPKYKNIQEYQKLWLDLVMMESAASMVASKESVTICDVPVQFELTNDSKLTANFHFTKDFLYDRKIILTSWYEKGGIPPDYLKEKARLDSFCIQV